MKRKNEWRKILNLIAKAKQQQIFSKKIQDLCIALEILLGVDKSKDEKKFTFSMRGAWLLSPKSFADRKKHYSFLQEIYDYRSSVVHSGILKQQDEKKCMAQFQAYTDIAENICIERLLQNAIINKDYWNDIVLGKMM